MQTIAKSYSLARHSRFIGNSRYKSIKRGKQSFLTLVVVVATVIIYVTTRLFNRRPLHVLVQFADDDHSFHHEISLLIKNLDPRKNEKVLPTLTTSLRNNANTSPKSTIRKNTILNPRWILNPVNKCKSRSPSLVILIASYEENYQVRDVIRNTWCKKQMFTKNRNILCLFVIGERENNKDVSNITEEFRNHTDIIKQSFIDNERNSTRKLLAGLEWIYDYCNNAKFLMKTEDDVIVNTDVIIKLLSEKEESINFAAGKCWSDSPNRNPTSRFYVSEELYPENQYPMYCSGKGWIMSANVAQQVLAAARHEVLLPLDDVFVGILLQKLKILPVDIPGFLLGRLDENDPCKNLSTSAVLHAHGMDLHYIWEILQEKCKI